MTFKLKNKKFKLFFVNYINNNDNFDEDDLAILIYLKGYLNKIIDYYYVNLENKKILINRYGIVILYFLFKGLNIDGTNFKKQIDMNNQRNILSLINLLFPYVDDKDNMKNQKEIRNINELVNKQIISGNDNKLKYSNYFYDHSEITDMKFTNENNVKKIELDVNKKKIFDKEYNIYYENVTYLILDIIDRIRYKFYINWINTFPLTIENYKDSVLFKNSLEYNSIEDEFMAFNTYKSKLYFRILIEVYNGNELNEDILNVNYIKEQTNFNSQKIKRFLKPVSNREINYEDFSINYYGINLEDIYNTHVIDYYYSVKNCKWLIYEIVEKNTKDIKLYIQVLDDILDLDSIINDDFIILPESFVQVEFKNKLNNFINNLFTINFYNLSKDNLQLIFVHLIINFEKKYSKFNKNVRAKHVDFQSIIELEDDISEYIIVEDNNVKYNGEELSIILFINHFEKYNYEEYIYDFLNEQIKLLQQSSYRNILFKDDKLNRDELNKYKLPNNFNKQDYTPTPKNYYNFGKLLCMKIDNNDLFCKNWEGLSFDEKLII